MRHLRSRRASRLVVLVLSCVLAVSASPILTHAGAPSPPPPGIPQALELLRGEVARLQARVESLRAKETGDVSALLAQLAALTSRIAALEALQPPGRLLFIERDAVQAFDLMTGQGQQVGTTTGKVSGTTSVQFSYAPAGPPQGDVLPIVFHKEVIVTDLDGDQLLYTADGTGSFHLGVPGFDFRGTGGPLTGTYVVTSGTGKYTAWTSATPCSYRAIATSPPSGLGTAYVELSECD